MGVHSISRVDLLSALVLLPAAGAAAIAGLAYIRSLRRQLRRSRAHLEMVLDNMKDGLVVLNPDHTIALMNRTGSQLVSVPSKKLSYRTVAEQFEAFRTTGDPIPYADWPSSRALRGDFVRNFIIVYCNKLTGETGSREITTAPVPANAGEPGQVVISYRDDSERRHVDLSRSRLAAIVESSRDAIVSTDLRGIITSWNSAAAAMTGYSREEMVGQHVERLLPPNAPGLQPAVMQRIVRGESVDHFQAERFTKDGRIIRVDISLAPLRDINREVIGVSSIARDITETCELQRQLQESQKMQALGQLAGGFAHDFNNLLAIVMGNLELLQSDSELSPVTGRRIRTAANATVRGAALIRHLLAFSSNEHLKPVATTLNDNLLRIFQNAARSLPASIRISTSLNRTLPAIFVDPDGLQSALTNLALNARDAMPAGGTLRFATAAVEFDQAAPEVTSGRIGPGRYAQLLMTDTGHGMSRETLDRAFEPFFTTRQRSRGTGLGLAAVYGFARQSGGSVHIESEPGAGATISLFLPFAAETAVPDPLTLPFPPALPCTPSRDTQQAPPASASRPIQSLLLVDDEGDLLYLIGDFLTRVGYTVFTARSAEEALRIAAETRGLELLVTDVVFSNGSNGVALAKALQQAAPGIQVLYTSGFQAHTLAERGLLVDSSRLLPKPYRLDQLHSAIRDLSNVTVAEAAI